MMPGEITYAAIGIKLAMVLPFPCLAVGQGPLIVVIEVAKGHNDTNGPTLCKNEKTSSSFS